MPNVRGRKKIYRNIHGVCLKEYDKIDIKDIYKFLDFSLYVLKLTYFNNENNFLCYQNLKQNEGDKASMVDCQSIEQWLQQPPIIRIVILAPMLLS